MDDNRLEETIHGSLDARGELPCATAFRIASDLDIEPLQIGRAANDLGIKLTRCQLGLFGYGSKAEGKHKIVEPAGVVDADLAQLIHHRVEDNRLSCKTAWDVAASLGLPKMKVSAAAEAMGIKIVRCQLGAF